MAENQHKLMEEADALTVDVLVGEKWQNLTGVEAITQECVREAVFKTHPKLLELNELEITVNLSDDATVHELNKNYRNKDKPTNVLSFASLEVEQLEEFEQAASPIPLLLGDIVLAYDTVSLESQTQNKKLIHHLMHLLVHGSLHLLGYDHQNDDDALVMEGLETKILYGMGVKDPYGN